MTEPLVSIVLPVFNGSRYLDEAVQSCIEQTYRSWNLIIVDDASTDDTPERIARYERQDKRIRPVRHDTNQKLPRALNTGFSLAKGAYLTWTSDDNCYRPKALERMVEFLETYKSIGFVYTDFTFIDNDGTSIRKVSVGSPEQLGLSNCIGGCFLYRRSVMEQVGAYREEMFLAEDYDFWLRVAAKFTIQPLHEDLYLYRLHPDSLGSVHQRKILSITGKVLKTNLPFILKKSKTDRALRINAGLHLARIGLKQNDRNAAVSYLKEQARRAPLRVARQFPCLVTEGLLGKKIAKLAKVILRKH